MKKTLTLVLSLALAVAIGIGGTLAWLTAQTSTITNTFTVGQLILPCKRKKSARIPSWMPRLKRKPRLIRLALA